MLIIAIAYCVFFFGIKEQRKKLEVVSHMEAIKTVMPVEYSMNQMDLIEMRLFEIRSIMGIEDLHRIMLDTAISKNANCMLYTANPVLPSRVLFDTDYFHR